MKSKKAMEIETFEERYRGNYLNKFTANAMRIYKIKLL